jgi:Probable zinc-ribbon domain
MPASGVAAGHEIWPAPVQVRQMSYSTRSTIADLGLACSGCGQTFIFSAGEQELQLLRGIRQIPGYCRPCARRLRSSGRDPSLVPASAGVAGPPPEPNLRVRVAEFLDEPTHIHVARRRRGSRVGP